MFGIHPKTFPPYGSEMEIGLPGMHLAIRSSQHLAAPNATYLTTYSPDGKLLQALTPFPAPTLRGLTLGKPDHA